MLLSVLLPTYNRSSEPTISGNGAWRSEFEHCFGPPHGLNQTPIERSRIRHPQAGAAEIGGNDRSELREPAAHGLVGDVQAPLAKHHINFAT
jgi:hypothetical protein